MWCSHNTIQHTVYANLVFIPSIVWHQFLRRDLIAWASIISSKVFRIRQNSEFNGFTLLYLVFFVSACMHAMMYIPATMKYPNCGVGHIFQWYSLCACAIIVEDFVQKWGKKVLRRYGLRRDSRLHYWVGYLWVWSFFSWSLPKVVFPKDDCVPWKDYPSSWVTSNLLSQRLGTYLLSTQRLYM